MRFFQLIIGLFAAALLAACGEQGSYYEKSPESVVSALETATLPYHILGSMAKGTRVYKTDDHTVVTALLGPEDQEMMLFVTTITPDGLGSRVNVTIQPPSGSNGERMATDMKSRPYVVLLLRKIADEHVASTVEGRPFNMMFAATPMAKGVIAANPEMQAEIDQANAAAAAANEANDATSYGSSQGTPKGWSNGKWGK